MFRELARERARHADQTVLRNRAVDAALRALGKAFSNYLATAPGGRPEDRNRLARRSAHAIAAATFAASQEFAEAAELTRRPPRGHWKPLAKAVEGTIGEFDVEPDPEADPS